MFQNQNTANNGGGIIDGASSGKDAAGSFDPSQQQNINYNGMPSQQQQQQQSSASSRNARRKPYVKITEQPASKALRFRYECEGRSAGSIPGANSTSENKTYPTIEIVGYKGRAVVVVSCVTKEAPYRPHPHNLVGKEGCKKGVCTLEINSETMRAVFSNLGIQCVKKKDIEAALRAREEIRVDPFKTGFSHRFQPSSIDLNSVRLCFQVFMESDQKGRFTQPLPPVVSEPIFDKKAMSDLVICRLCSCSATVLGNTQIILLCEKVTKEDITVRFFEEKNDQVVWEAFGEFQHTDVHKQTAIAFKTPRYHTLDITEPAKVFIQLRRPSDGVTSESLPFEYIPLDSDPAHLRRKRQKTGGDPIHLLLQQQQKQHQNDSHDGRQSLQCWNANIPAIKTEPRDTSPQPFGLYRAPPELTPSPQPLSPSNNYNPNSTPSPYSVGQPTPNAASRGSGTPMNPQIISPNHQYNANNNNTAQNTQPMDIHAGDYTNFNQQQQQHAHALHHQQQQQQQQQQQHFQANLFGSAGASHWEGKFAAIAANSSNNSNNMGNLSNQTNAFTMQNLLTSASNANANSNSAVGGGMNEQTHWNLALNHMHGGAAANVHQQLQHHMQQHGHHNAQYGHQSNSNDATNNMPSHNNGPPANNNNEHGPTLSNLLSFDSEQLVRINSEDQQMLRLNSEDLQISNLSIST